MKSKVRFRGKLRSYLCWPLWLTIPMTIADVGLYFYDVTAGFLLTVFIAVRRTRQLISADHVETVAGEIKILIGQLRAGGHVQYHEIVVRVGAHPQEQRLFILLDRFIVEEG